MALYGLSVFLETPKPLRKNRKRYIATSFLITVLRAFCASLDMAHYFQILFKSTSPDHWGNLMTTKFNRDWKYYLSLTELGLGIMIGDALLVRVVPWFFQASGKAYRSFVTGVSVLYSLRAILVGVNPADDHVPVRARSVSCPLQSTIYADPTVRNRNL